MSRIANVPISTKIYLSFSLMLAVVLFLGLYMLKSIKTIEKLDAEKSEFIALEADLRALQVVHYKWVDQMRSAVNNHTKFEGQLDPEKCGFGKWYYSYKVQYPELKEIFDALEEPHRKLHRSGAEVVRLMEENRIAEAEKLSQQIRGSMLPNLMKLYDPFVEKINSLYLMFAEKSQKFIASANSMSKIAMFFSAVFTAFIALFLVKLIISPLKTVVSTAKQVAGGNLLNLSLKQVDRKDEIGELSNSFYVMVQELSKLVGEAEQISRGDLSIAEVESRLNSGMDFEKAVALESDKNGDLAQAFQKMRLALRKLAVQAKKIAVDELNDPVLNVQIEGELGAAFSQMNAKLREFARLAENMAVGDLNVNVANSKGVLAGSFEKMIGSLKSMLNSANQIASGDLTGNIQMRSDKDHLNLAFRKMVENLRELLGKVKVIANTVAKASTQLEQVSTQSVQTTGQISSATTSIAQSSQAASVASQGANTAGVKGRDFIEKLVKKIAVLKEVSETNARAMAGLSNRSVQIGEIVDVITKIADQTNLLSLNAAIEAARAGEAGRGFAVVADEVRKLAENSAASAEEISKIINDVQNDSKSATEASINGKRESEESALITVDASKMFSEVVAQVESIARQIEQIAASAEETSASAEESTASTEELSASVSQLEQSTRDLLAEVNKFKLS